MSTPPSEVNEVVLPQKVVGPLTRSAIFLVLCLTSGDDVPARVREFYAGLSGLVRAVGFRESEAGLTCVAGFGSEAWDRLFGSPRPAELHPFRELRAGARLAPSTPGDLLFHIRSKRMDFCFELATHIMDELGDAVTVADEVHGFRYFDARDLLGFVDGTENPAGETGARRGDRWQRRPSVLRGQLRDRAKVPARPRKPGMLCRSEMQERIIGRAEALGYRVLRL